MKDFRNLIGIVTFVLVVSLCVSSVASAKDGGSGNKKEKKLPKHAQGLQAQIDANTTSIENIELTPGPQGDQGPAGDDGQDGADGAHGATGADGVGIDQTIENGDGTFTIIYSDETNFTTSDLTGPKGESIQGPQGDPGTSSWVDGFGTVSTAGSVQVGSDSADCTTANEGTIRYNTTSKTLELCNGTKWSSITVAGSGSGSGDGNSGTDQMEDADGNLYNTVLIGNQYWMAENLNVGTMVNGTTEQTNNAVREKYCYDNNQNNCATDGGLYQWDEIMQYSTTEGASGLCPNGWHLPTDTEWKTLEITLNMSQEDADLFGWREGDQGIQLKAGGTSGFDALLAGARTANGGFGTRGSHAYFWTSTENVIYRILSTDEERIFRDNANGSTPQIKESGVSVRCVKD